MRAIIGIIIILLPLAHDLDLTAIMSIIMALMAFCVIWENITSLMRCARFWEKWEHTRYPETNSSQNQTVAITRKDELEDAT